MIKTIQALFIHESVPTVITYLCAHFLNISMIKTIPCILQCSIIVRTAICTFTFVSRGIQNLSLYCIKS